MKLLLILLVLFTGVLFRSSECTQQAWLPSMLDSLANRTTQLKHYIREKGKNFKLYSNKVQSKFSSYFKSTTAADTQSILSSAELGVTANPVDSFFNDVKIDILKGKKFNAKKPVEDLKLVRLPYLDKYVEEFLPLPRRKTKAEKCTSDCPLALLTTPQLIAANGYPAESHTVVTNDGYILTVHRIPHAKSRLDKSVPFKTALLHHGLLGSSADWVITGPRRALAYILADAGYDVWLANVRGNTYSRAHVNLTVDSVAFWNFTFHEVSQYDLPALIDHIMDVKGMDVKINYIGHSMGTTVLFALLSTKVHYNKVLRAGFALAPVAYMTNIRSPIRLLARFSNHISYLMKILGANEFLPQSAVLRWLSKHACEINNYEEVLCENSLFVLCGNDEKQFNRTLMPILLNHVPAGASTKTIIHYAQEIKNGGRFQQFDYGPEGNLKQYGTSYPPIYEPSKITLPMALFSAENDWLSGELDVANLYAELVNPIQHYIVPLKTFNHIDFLWAIDAPLLVYEKLLQLLEDGISRPTAYFDLDSKSFD